VFYSTLITLFVCHLVLWSEKELHDAAKRNDLDRMQELIRKGVDVKAKNKVRLLMGFSPVVGSVCTLSPTRTLTVSLTVTPFVQLTLITYLSQLCCSFIIFPCTFSIFIRCLFLFHDHFIVTHPSITKPDSSSVGRTWQ